MPWIAMFLKYGIFSLVSLFINFDAELIYELLEYWF